MNGHLPRPRQSPSSTAGQLRYVDYDLDVAYAEAAVISNEEDSEFRELLRLSPSDRHARLLSDLRWCEEGDARYVRRLHAEVSDRAARPFFRRWVP